MKFVTAKYANQVYTGIVSPDEKKVLLLNLADEKRTGKQSFPASMQECVALGPRFIEQVEDLFNWVEQSEKKDSYYFSMEEVTLLAPIPRPRKNIFCVGKNYAEHAIEMGSADDIPEHIMVFTKVPTTVIGPHTEVLNHSGITEQLDYEGELAIVIGKEGRGIEKEQALDYIFGYTIINDITARDLQARHKQFFIGKSLDTTCPMGPWIVHKDEIDNPNHLAIETKVNGEVRQRSNTENFIFPIEEIISVLSKGMTLEPGDIIATGTPAGVGKGFNPPKFLKPGDQMEITIEKVGTLVNTIDTMV